MILFLYVLGLNKGENKVIIIVWWGLVLLIFRLLLLRKYRKGVIMY